MLLRTSRRNPPAPPIPPVPAAIPPAQESSAAEFFQGTLEQISTIFGRLVHIAALRDASTGRYHHPLLGFVSTTKELNEIVGRAHVSTFTRWLSLNVAQQRGDLARYLGQDETNQAMLLRRIWESGAMASTAPPSASSHEKLLFTTDLAMLVPLMLNGFDS